MGPFLKTAAIASVLALGASVASAHNPGISGGFFGTGSAFPGYINVGTLVPASTRGSFIGSNFGTTSSFGFPTQSFSGSSFSFPSTVSSSFGTAIPAGFRSTLNHPGYVNIGSLVPVNAGTSFNSVGFGSSGFGTSIIPSTFNSGFTVPSTSFGSSIIPSSFGSTVFPQSSFGTSFGCNGFNGFIC